jgi:serine 3-dehydrogenase (NADP+)
MEVRMGRLEGTIAVVVGGSSGMGRATALAFAAEGAKVVVSAPWESEILDVVAMVERKGGEAVACVADVTSRSDMDSAVGTAVTEFGRVDVLANFAGVNIRNRRLADLDQAGWEHVIGVNLTGALNCTQAVLPEMRAQGGGLIIHIASVSAIWGDLAGAAYQASKHGMVGLANATMMEERLNGIRVTLIYPGLCNTGLLDYWPVPPAAELRTQMMQPEDIAQACVFLAALPSRTYVSDLTIMPGAFQCNGNSVGQTVGTSRGIGQ